MRCKRTGEKKKLLITHLLVALKNLNLKNFYHLCRLPLHFPNFFTGLENCWANFKTFFQEFKALCEPCHPQYQETFL